MRHLSLPAFIMGSAILLAGCMEPGPIRGTIHSNSYKLRLGMTVEEVEAIIAPATYVRFNPKNALIAQVFMLQQTNISLKYLLFMGMTMIL